MVIVSRQCALWHGDGKYDYIRWENIGADPYQNDNGNSDIDGIDEEDLEGKQLTEVGSEFDYYGIYENYMGRDSINIPCFRHYYEYRFVREPGHCLSQFGPGTEAYNSNMLHTDISSAFPDGIHPATQDDISYLIKVWSLRNDISKWNPRYRHLISSLGEWIVQERNDDLAGGSINGNGAAYQPIVIIGDSADRDKGLALGLYRPESEININVISGVVDSTGEISYTDNRTIATRIIEQPVRAGNMSKYGFYLEANGILNPTRTDQGTYEMVRSEFYILVGTPAEIEESAQKIHEFTYREPAGTEWHFTSDLEGWVLFKSLTGNATEGILNLEITGADPYMNSPDNLSVDASSMNQVIIRMRNGTNTNSGRIYWTTDTQATFKADNSKQITLIPNDEEFTDYVIDMWGEPGWIGTIRRIRLDPSNEATSGSVDIDYIMINENPSASAGMNSTKPSTRIYPIPAEDYFMVEGEVQSMISVYDGSGRLVVKRSSNSQVCRFLTGGWEPGLYLIRIEKPGGTEFHKMLIK